MGITSIGGVTTIQECLRRWRRPEAKAAAVLWCYLFLLIVGLVLGRSVGTALFLNRFSGSALALVYVVVGIVAASTVAVIERLGRMTGPFRQAGYTLALIGALALGAAQLLGRVEGATSDVFHGILYLAIETFGIVTTVQFWAMANRMLSLEQARRSYAVIGTGGIFGSIIGGALTRSLSSGPIDRMFVWIAAVVPLQLLAIAAFRRLARRLHRSAPKRDDAWNLDAAAATVGLARPRRTQSAQSADSESRDDGSHATAAAPVPADDNAERKLGRAYGLVSLLMVFSTTLVDYFYKVIAVERYSGSVEDLVAFFGGFYLCVGLTTLVCQATLTPLVLRKGSAFSGLAASPISLLVVAIGNLAWPSVWSAALFKLTDSVLMHSVYRSCQEMLYTPLPTRWVPRLKSWSDGVWGRAGLMLAGLFLLVFQVPLESFGPQALHPVLLVVFTAWLVSVSRLRTKFIRGAAPTDSAQRFEIAAVPVEEEQNTPADKTAA